MIHADGRLAQRLEELVCREFCRLAEVARTALPGSEAECAPVADGVALWLGKGSPVNIAVGLAMHGPVGDGDLDHLESFYRRRDAAATLSACPLADGSLLRLLARRGWLAREFEHLLVLDFGDPRRTAALADLAVDLDPTKPAAGIGAVDKPHAADVIEVRVCSPEERPAWAAAAARGFSDGEAPEQGHEEFSAVMAARPEAVLVLAWVNGVPAGTGALVMDGGVGWLSGDSTLPQYRRRGIQQAIQRFRLQLAREAGCELAVTEAVPGGASQRNMERVGFRIAYTHVEFTKEAPHGT